MHRRTRDDRTVVRPLTVRVAYATLVRNPWLAVLTAWYALLIVGLGTGLGHAYGSSLTPETDRAWWLVLGVYALVCGAAYRALGSLWRASLHRAVRDPYM